MCRKIRVFSLILSELLIFLNFIFKKHSSGIFQSSSVQILGPFVVYITEPQPLLKKKKKYLELSVCFVIFQ